MRREIIYKSASRVVQDLKTSGIQDLAVAVVESLKRGKNEPVKKIQLPTKIFQDYIIATHDYSDSEKKICEIFELDVLFDVSYWDALINRPNPEIIRTLKNNVNFAINQIPKILLLVKQDYVTEIKEHDGSLSREFDNKEILTVLIVEDNMHFSSPQRLAHVLNSITLFYEVFSILENESKSDLSVVACDSGSDKSFDFLGLSSLVEKIKEFIVTIWDLKVLHRHREMHETLNLITDSLPILERIENLKKNKAIGIEEAEILKRNVLTGVGQFLEAGATIPELNHESNHSPRELMKPEQRLLVAPVVDDINEKEESVNMGDEPLDSKLSAEEIEQFEKLLKKAKKSNNDEST